MARSVNDDACAKHWLISGKQSLFKRWPSLSDHDSEACSVELKRLLEYTSSITRKTLLKPPDGEAELRNASI